MTTLPDHDHGLICAYVLDGAGGASRVRWAEVREGRLPPGPLWVHLDREEPQARRWIEEGSGINVLAAEAMITESSRPRIEGLGPGMLMILRGVNLNPGADPEDMVSLRFWAENDRVITTRHRKLMAVQDVRDAIEAGNGPANIGELTVSLAGRLLDRMGPALADLEDGIDELEESALEDLQNAQRSELAGLRRETILLRRYIAPQRDVMARLQDAPVDWLSDSDRMRARELHDRVTRYVEDLDSARDRAQVVQEEVQFRLAEQTNRTMYLLSIVAAIFLPLGLITGLLGINVGGVPGTDEPAAFAVVAALLVVIALVEAWLFRRARWF